MSLVLRILQRILNQPSTFISERTDLNLPKYLGKFPFSYRQKPAVEMALSNAPVVAIGGLPGSGKTEIALAALETGLQHQRSTLIVAPDASIFEKYMNLPIPPLLITRPIDYQQTIRTWIGQQLIQPKIDFLPPHWLADQLFEKLQAERSTQFWLELLNIQEKVEKKQKLSESIEEILPNIHPQRQRLLAYRLEKSKTLLEQRERLRQTYSRLSEHGIEQIIDASLPHLKIPILCLPQQLSTLSDRTFDLVIVEESNDIDNQSLGTIALRSKKLVLLGKVKGEGLFRRIFSNLYPAYRLHLKENHRLHPELSAKIFPHLFPLDPRPYTPFNSKYVPISSGNYRLTWLNIRGNEQLLPALQQSIAEAQLSYDQVSILTFTSTLADRIKQELPQLSDAVSCIENWRGKECKFIWIICDIMSENQPILRNWKLALTRATQMITVLGDWRENEQQLEDLQSEFHFVRDLSIEED